MNKAYSYIRMSTEMQLKGNSLDRQLKLARAYAQEKNLELDEDSYNDLGISAYKGKNSTNGKLSAFISDAEKGYLGKNPILIVENLDRISRQNTLDAFNLLMRLVTAGIEIHTLSDRQIYNKQSLSNYPGVLFSSIGHMLRAHSESELKSERIKKSWDYKRSQIDKKILTRNCPKWITYNEQRECFELITPHAQTIKKIFDLSINENMGVYSITRYLNKNSSTYPSFSIPQKENRRKPHPLGWHMSYVTKILNNPSVHGAFQPSSVSKDGKRFKAGSIIEDYFPAVVTKHEFLLSQSKIKSRAEKKGGRKGSQFNNIFSKLTICGSCGGPIHMIDKGQGPKGGKYLKCYNSHYQNKCDSAAWKYNEFFDAFIDFTTELDLQDIFKPDIKEKEINALYAERDLLLFNITNTEKNLENILSITEAIDAKTAKAIGDIFTKKNNELSTLKKDLEDIKLKIANIENLQTQKSNNELINLAKELRKSNKEEDANTRRAFNKALHDMISNISIYTFKGNFNADIAQEKMPSFIKKYFSKKEMNNLISQFSEKNGKKFYSDVNRFFIIKFKSDEERIVHPFLLKSIKSKTNMHLNISKYILINALTGDII